MTILGAIASAAVSAPIGITAIAIVTKFPNDLDCNDIESYRKGQGIDSISGVEAVISHLISKYFHPLIYYLT